MKVFQHYTERGENIWALKHIQVQIEVAPNDPTAMYRFNESEA